MIAMTTRMTCCLLCCLLACSSAAVELTFSGKGEIFISKQEPAAPLNKTWFNRGTGQLDYAESVIGLGPQYFTLDAATDSAFSGRIHAQWHNRPETGLSITEAWLNWAPLPVNGYRLRARIGYFYPQLSLENTDTAWTSPYSSTFSAINSWVAEEIRARGGEFSIGRPGHFFQSSQSWTAFIGAFQGNDPAGTILAWRGFALHNLQTGLGERVDFANYLSLQTGPLALQNPWVEPTRELDHRTGYYVGVHWQYEQQTRIRAYHYDNNGDPLVFSHQQYGWRTRFNSIAMQHFINDNWQFVAQWLDGNTLMGPGAVDADFTAWFLLAHWQRGAISATVRYDDFKVVDKDTTPNDNNNGNGQAILLALSYSLNDQLNVGVEHVLLNSEQQNRQQWAWPVKQQQTLSKVVLTWRWR